MLPDFHSMYGSAYSLLFLLFLLQNLCCWKRYAHTDLSGGKTLVGSFPTAGPPIFKKLNTTDFTFLPNVMRKMVQKLLVDNMETKKVYNFPGKPDLKEKSQALKFQSSNHMDL